MAHRPIALPPIDPQEVIGLTRSLVALPSENPPGNEGPVAATLGAYLQAAGFAVTYEEVFPGRPNLLATFQAGSSPSLLLCGHSDTMPITGTWTTDPHAGEIRQGRLYGRGTVDMKGGLAAMAVSAAMLVRADALKKGSLLLAVVIDEENLGAGARRLMETGVRADWAIIAEPTGNVPVIVSNGQINMIFTIRGRAAHGSSPWKGRSAIYDGLLLVSALREYAGQVFAQRAHPLVGPPSINVGTFHGGAQTSIVPDACRITLDRRVAPGETTAQAIAEVQSLLDRLRAEQPGLEVEMEIPYCLPPVVVDEQQVVVRALRAAGRDVLGADPGVAGMRATTDAAFLYGDGGIPTVVCGPGSMEQAHRPDEYVEVQQLVDATQIFLRTAARLLGAGSQGSEQDDERITGASDSGG